MNTRSLAIRPSVLQSASDQARRPRWQGGRARALLAAIVLVLSYLVPTSAAQDEAWVGRRVMVVREGAQFRVKGKRPVPAPVGMVLEVSRVNGRWLWGEGPRGWVKQSDVVPQDEALDHFTAQIDRKPTSKAYQHRGIALAALGNFDESINDFAEAIRRDANNVAATNDRGNVLRKLGRLDDALADFNTVIERGVRHPAVYTNRGLVWHEKGDYDRALADFNTALRIDAEFAPAWEAGGAARQAKGDDGKAIANYRRATELAPDFHRAHNNLAWLLATDQDAQLRDGEAAVRHATTANELSHYSDADYLDTLAAALAEAGQFDDAVRRAKEVMEKASADRKTAIQHRLELYDAQKPFRESGE
ncbi:MAG: tetratricopeptide repeat protein [Pirellulaceae bacterium]